jgi:hypothetical protein
MCQIKMKILKIKKLRLLDCIKGKKAKFTHKLSARSIPKS